MQKKREFFYSLLKKTELIFQEGNEKAFLIILLIISICSKLFHAKTALLQKGTVLFMQPDNYYHIRRTILFAHNFPSMNSFDSYLSYPVGAECPWPPLYDWIIAMISLIVTGGKVNNYVIELITAILPIVLAAIAVFPVFYITKRVSESKILPYLTSLFFIFSPGLFSYSVFSSGDHHAAEIFLAICFYYFAIESLNSLLNGTRNRKHEILTALFASLGLLVWHIQIFYFTLWLLFIAVLVTKKFKDKKFTIDILKSNFLIFFITIFVAVLFRFLSPITTEQGVLRFDFFSFFQPFYIFLLLLPFVYLYFFLQTVNKKKFLIYTVLLFLSILSIFFLIKPVIDAFKELNVFLTKSEPYLTNIQEYKPPFRKGHFLFSGVKTLKNYLYFLFLSLPVFFSFINLAAFVAKKHNDKREILKTPLYLLFCTTSFLFFYQTRWGVESSFGLAYTHAAMILLVWSFSKRLFKTNLNRIIVTLFYTAIMLALPAKGTWDLMVKAPVPVSPDLYFTVKWINNNTPKTSYYLTPYKKPEYGILTPWDIGHLTLYYGERPVCASNFGHSLRGTGFKDSMAIWQSPDDKVLDNICNRNNVKFLIISDPLGYMTGLENMLFFYNYPAMRLMQFDGSFCQFGPALEHFRLIYESVTRNENTYNLTDVRKYKVYEFVKGARLFGKTYPNETINIFTTFRSDKGREFRWSLRTFSDEHGNYSCVIPYATTNVKYNVRAMYPFKATVKEKEITFNIDEQDVQEGKQIVLNLK